MVGGHDAIGIAIAQQVAAEEKNVSETLCIRDVLVLDPLQPEGPQQTDFLIRDGTIAARGNLGAAIESDPPARIIDGRNRLLLPGLINAHTHSPLNILKGTGDILSHPAFMWRNQADTAARTPDEIRLSTLLGCIEHLLNGTTSVIDHFPEQGFSDRDVDAAVDAYQMSGMRALVALRVFDEDYADIMPEGGLPTDIDAANPLRPPPLAESLALIKNAIEKHDHSENGRIRICPAPSNPGRCSDDLLVAVTEMAEHYDTSLHAHLLETQIQKQLAVTRHGVTMVKHLDRLGFLNDRLSCAHTIWIDDDDIELMAARGAIAVHNPESNLKIGAGIAPISRMLKAGMTVALGTDGASTNDNLDMHEVMRFAIMLQRPFEKVRAHWPSAADAFTMATTAGAKALRVKGLGTLEPGAPADLVLHDLEAPFWTPMNDALSQLVFGGSGSTVDTVIAGGKVMVEQGRIVAFDPEPILNEARDLVRHLRGRSAALQNWAKQVEEAVP